MSIDTIFALSSGSIPAGVAIIRVSGPKVRFAFETLIGFVPETRNATLAKIFDHHGELIDRGLVLYFNGPYSFTGEDCGEFHIHGSRAVLDSFVYEIGQLDGFRMADPGEFSRRAFENGKLDLIEVEGLSDLIHANTEEQRLLALKLAEGKFSTIYSDWRSRLISLRAYIEAGLDFSEEEDVVNNLDEKFIQDLDCIILEISGYLETSRSGEIIRNGYKVVLMGPPNSGKSSLLNALAKSDVAIVSEYAGTTRDVICVNLNIGGFEVVVSDTAGIRDSEDVVEKIGISRAIETGRSADLIIWLMPSDVDTPEMISDELFAGSSVLSIFSKTDLLDDQTKKCDYLAISTVTNYGLEDLKEAILGFLATEMKFCGELLLSNVRHKLLLESCLDILRDVSSTNDLSLELISEELRLASDKIGRISGKIDVEDLLDVIFNDFCIGK